MTTPLCLTLLLLLIVAAGVDKIEALAARRFNASGLGVDSGSLQYGSSFSSKKKRPSSDLANPLTFFEVSRPVSIPGSAVRCAELQLLNYSFGNTINSPPVTVPYTPPDSKQCRWDRAILKWKVESKGRQFDRISAVWLGRVEIFRTSTAEPTKQGIVWQVQKDISKYSSLLRKRHQQLAVSLGNVIDSTYTGFFNVTLTVDYYATKHNSHRITAAPYSSPPASADIVLPISMPIPSTNGGYWFQLQNDTDSQGSTLRNLPRNMYKAALEIYVSFHGDDEFWYSNPTNDYLKEANISNVPGNGPFREVVAQLDGADVGHVCPLPVIFTGGINPLFWRPAAAIGAFDLPSYTLDLTPFVGQLVDGGSHQLRLSVTNALRFWLVDANLHLWIDRGSQNTSGKLTVYSSQPADVNYKGHYQGSDGTLQTNVARSLSYQGYVASSLGNLTTSASYSYSFSNRMDFSQHGDVSVVNQGLDSQTKFVVKNGKQDVAMQQTSSSYPLYLYTSQQAGDNRSVSQEARINHGLVQEVQGYRYKPSDYDDGGYYFSRLDNRQQTDGKIVIQGNSVVSGIGELEQQYAYESTQGCYNRYLKTKNYTVSYDQVSTNCVATTS